MVRGGTKEEIITGVEKLLSQTRLVEEEKDPSSTQDKKVITLVSQNYINDYKKVVKCDFMTDKEELLYRRILIATDFISGMTDGYAKTLYKKMSGLE